MSTTAAAIAKPAPTVVEAVTSSSSSPLGTQPDDVSDASVLKSAHSGELSVLSREKSALMKSRGPRLVACVSCCQGLPKGFKEELPFAHVPLSLIVTKGEDGRIIFKRGWITSEALLCIWEVVKDFLHQWQVDLEILDALQSKLNVEDCAQRLLAIANFLPLC